MDEVTSNPFNDDDDLELSRINKDLGIDDGLDDGID